MFKFISKRLSKYLEDNNYIKSDQVISADRLTKLRTDFQLKFQAQEDVNKQLRKITNISDQQIKELSNAIEALNESVKNVGKQAASALDQLHKELNKEFIALRKADRTTNTKLDELIKKPVDYSEFRCELDKKLIPIRKICEEAQEASNSALENTKAFKELYDGVITNTKRQHRKFETVMPQDQTESKEDN